MAEAGEAFAELVRVLTGQRRGRSHHSHLTASRGDGEGGAECHFGLAETDIADHQTVHHLARRQIG
jgi:hypothetical protein